MINIAGKDKTSIYEAALQRGVKQTCRKHF